jgi:condensin complex subunit 1
MLHLIWAKENSTVEDGKEIKGVRSRVIECYRKLFFDPLAALSAEENVARTARNMIK